MIATPADRDALVRGLLIESELDPDDAVLLGTLQDLHALGEGPVPLPSAEVATGLAPSRRPRRLGRRGATLVVLIAAATLGTGLSAAASPAVRTSAQHAIEAIVHVVAPPAPVTRRGAGPSDAPRGTAGSAHPSSVPSAVPRSVDPAATPATASTSASAGAAAQGKAVGPAGAHPVRHRTPTTPVHAPSRSGVSHGRSATPAPTASARAVPHAAVAHTGKGASSGG